MSHSKPTLRTGWILALGSFWLAGCTTVSLDSPGWPPLRGTGSPAPVVNQSTPQAPVAPSVPDANPETVAQQAEPFRSRSTDTSQGAWAAQADKPLPYLPPTAANTAPPARAGLPVWGFALLLLACWLPYLFAVWPGTVSNDSITQLKQIFGLIPLENSNPLTQTGLLWLSVRAGMGIFGSADAVVALYVCVQATLMAWL